MATSLPERSVPDISFMLAHISHVLATRMAAALEEIGMTSRGQCVLAHALPGGLSQIELARLSDLDKTTMVVTLDELEKAGYARREPSPMDRRARVVVVTEDGARIAAAGQGIADRVHQEVLGALPQRERQAFVDALDRLVSGPLAAPVESERTVRRPRTPK